MISIFTGVAGMRAGQRAIDVIANNIANLNTIAFKSGRVSFQEALVQTLRAGSTAGTNPMQVGLGVGVASIDNIMDQGNLKSTSRPTDLAITGDGFFIVSNGTGFSYTRDGNFQLDANNRLVSASNGMAVEGWAADPATGQINTSANLSPSSALTIPLGTMAVARQTSNSVFKANLDASSAADTVVNSTFSIYDSLGQTHQITVAFTKSDTANTWDWTASSPDGTSDSTGTLTFDANGQLDTAGNALSLTLTNPNGATSPIDLTLDFSTVTQLVGDSNVQVVSQDGLPTGTLQSFSIDQNGIITGVFDNGMAQTLGQLALARFANPAGLDKQGSNLYGVSPNSGIALIAPPGVGGTGTVSAGQLEMSNVDLANEFANLVVTQRGFQANSRVITTGDEMLQDLLTLKR
jgi:flagellar hook protein FlgE